MPSLPLDERRAVLTELERRGMADLAKVWAAAGKTGDFVAYILAAFPELSQTYGASAGMLSAQWYEDAAPDSGFVAKVAAGPSTEQLTSSAQWALNVGDATTGLALLQGSMQRAVWSTARDTTIWNTELEPGSRWARHASANACSFCRMLATRGAVYASEASATTVGGRGKAVSTNFTADGRRKSGGQAKGVRTRGTQGLGKKYHDHCHCLAVEVRTGSSYAAPAYVEAWQEEYLAARDATAKGPYGASDVQGIMREMRKND